MSVGVSMSVGSEENGCAVVVSRLVGGRLHRQLRQFLGLLSRSVCRDLAMSVGSD